MAARKKPISPADLRMFEQRNLPRGSSVANGAKVDPATGRNTGVNVGSAKGKGKYTQVSVSNAPRNLQGAPQQTARNILGIKGSPQEGVSDAELAAIRGDISNAGVGSGLAASGKREDPYAGLLKALTGLGDYSAGNINDSMDTLTGALQAQTNPFADFKAQSTTTTPELSALLQSQGVSQDPLQQFATAINAQNKNQATAFQNQADIMGKIYGANQQGAITDVGQQRASLLNQLQGNVLGTGAKLLGGNGKKALDKNSIMQMILQAMKVQG
jgi:hypothetical protein